MGNQYWLIILKGLIAEDQFVCFSVIEWLPQHSTALVVLGEQCLEFLSFLSYRHKNETSGMLYIHNNPPPLVTLWEGLIKYMGQQDSLGNWEVCSSSMHDWVSCSAPEDEGHLEFRGNYSILLRYLNFFQLCRCEAAQHFITNFWLLGGGKQLLCRGETMFSIDVFRDLDNGLTVGPKDDWL